LEIGVGVAKPACNVMRRLTGQRLCPDASTGDKQEQPSLQRGGFRTHKLMQYFQQERISRNILLGFSCSAPGTDKDGHILICLRQPPPESTTRVRIDQLLEPYDYYFLASGII
jgi:hypothetical protein